MPCEQESTRRFPARDLSMCSHDFLFPLVAECTDSSFPAVGETLLVVLVCVSSARPGRGQGFLLTGQVPQRANF
jgi:hypothetical protein